MSISHGTKIVGAALAGLTLFACGTPSVTQGTVIAVKYDPAHAKTKQVCKSKVKSKVKSSCLRYETKPDGWDDADYDLQVSDGTNLSWIEVDDPDVYQSCAIGMKYPDCADAA